MYMLPGIENACRLLQRGAGMSVAASRRSAMQSAPRLPLGNAPLHSQHVHDDPAEHDARKMLLLVVLQHGVERLELLEGARNGQCLFVLAENDCQCEGPRKES
jgi:hypothetical protein